MLAGLSEVISMVSRETGSIYWVLQWMQVNQHMRGVSPSLKVQPGPSGAQHHHIRPTKALARPAPQAAHLPSVSFSVLVVAGVLSQGCNSLTRGEVASNPFLKEMCVFHLKCSLGCREQAPGSLFSHWSVWEQHWTGSFKFGLCCIGNVGSYCPNCWFSCCL